MSAIRTLIVDDEPVARQGLRALLDDEPNITVIGECSDGNEAVHALESLHPDLLLLDVQMPGLSGFGVLKNANVERLPVVIFVTAYDQYSLRAFDFHAVDYLLKPFTNRRFKEAIDQAREKIRSQKDLAALNERMNELLARFEENHPASPSESQKQYLHRVAIKEGDRITFLNVEDIDWIEAADNYVCLHVEGRSYLLRSKLGEMEEELDPYRFLRIHRSRIVNVERIQEMLPQGSGDCIIILKDGTELTSSRTYREQRRKMLNPMRIPGREM